MLVLCASAFVFAFASALHHHVAGAARGPFILWFLPYLSYFMAGGVLRRWTPSIDKRRIVIVLISSAALTAIGCHVIAVRRGLPSGLYFYDYFSATVIPMALAAFLLLRHAPAMRILVGLAPLSLGVYLVHPLFLECISRLGFEEWRFNPIWAIPIKVLLILLLSLTAIWTIRRIPILRRVV
jgi:surface polysaccharide O-acyltransferase-like enzyme